MQKLDYEDVREWFWVRTAVWFLPVAIVSVMASFAYLSATVDEFGSRFSLAVAVGIGAAIFGLFAAAISIQFVWMRAGWRLGWVANLVTCAVGAAVMAVLVCSVIISIQHDDIHSPLSEDLQAAAYHVMLFAIALSGLWGALMGSWFALRKDKYFIEPI